MALHALRASGAPPARAGVLTPAAAVGDDLVARLRSASWLPGGEPAVAIEMDAR